MKPALYLILVILFHTNLYPQLYDSFSDGEFTSNPVWGGDTGDWQIVTSSAAGDNSSGSQTLRLNAAVAADGIKYLSSQLSGSWGTEQSWGFWVGRRTSATTTNQSIFWLWANEADLNSATIDGYRILFGNNVDEDKVKLERIDNGSVTNVLTSSGGVLNGLDDFGFLVRVTRNSSSNWTLFTSTLPDLSGTGAAAADIPSSTNASTNQGNATDNTYTNFDNGYLGMMCVYTSGSTARTGAEFDQIYFDTDASSPLPVELLNFNSKLINGKVLLTWETATEINNYGFEIQRSEFGNQNSEFKTVGFVNGHGNSSSNKYYSFVDDKPFNGENFYRLKQIDFDGGYEYSEAVGISFMKSQNYYLLEQNYPNPFNPITKISFHIPNVVDASRHGGQVNASATVSVYNILGELATTLVNQNLTAGKHEVEFDGSNLSSGVYYYSLEIGNFIQTKKMLLIK